MMIELVAASAWIIPGALVEAAPWLLLANDVEPLGFCVDPDEEAAREFTFVFGVRGQQRHDRDGDQT